MENPIKMDDLGVPLFSETAIWIGVFNLRCLKSPQIFGGFQVSLGTLQQGSGDCEGLQAAPAHSVTAAMAACEKGDLALSWLVGAEDLVGETYLKIPPPNLKRNECPTQKGKCHLPTIDFQ